MTLTRKDFSRPLIACKKESWTTSAALISLPGTRIYKADTTKDNP